MSVKRVLTMCGVLLGTTVVGTFSTTHATDAAGCSAQYQIKQGDTLLDISHDQLGTVFAVQHIIDANLAAVGHNPDLIYAGTTLSIPCEAALERPLDWTVVPDVTTLKALLHEDSVQVLDIRDTAATAAGFIPGAVHVPYRLWEAAAASEGDLSEIVGLSGLRLDKPIIIVNTKPSEVDLDQAAEVYRVLETIGAGHLAILRDGYRAWVTENLPVAVSAGLKDPYDIRVSFSLDHRSEMIDIFDGVAIALQDA
ncbi:MAG: rhodanese-like domain-containing protein [Pseudomonadota bacterium]